MTECTHAQGCKRKVQVVYNWVLVRPWVEISLGGEGCSGVGDGEDWCGAEGSVLKLSLAFGLDAALQMEVL